VRGLVFFGFPLHPAGKPDTTRVQHLGSVQMPVLFLQGTRDKLVDLGLLAPIVAGLGAKARMHTIEGADHSFALPKKMGRTAPDVWRELARVVGEWIKAHP
jgi:predicted alpha/beta-hydrolase family hydrolase